MDKPNIINLTIRCPVELHSELTRIAATERRSVTQQVIVLLQRAIKSTDSDKS